MNWNTDDEYYEYSPDGDKIDTRTNEIYKLRNRLVALEKAAIDETKLRMENPALMDAWKQYQTVLRMVEK